MTGYEKSVADEQTIKELQRKLKISQSHIDFRNKIDDFIRRTKEKFRLNGEKTEIPLGIFRSLQLLIEEKDLFAAYHIFSQSIGGLLRDQAERERAYKFDFFVREGTSLESFLQSDDIFKILPVFISQKFTENNFKYFEPLYIDRILNFKKKLSLISMGYEESIIEKKEFFPNTQHNQYIIWVCMQSFWITHEITLGKVRENLTDERFLYVFEIPQFYIKFKEKLRENEQYVFAGVLSRTDTYPVLIIENGKPRICDGMISGMEAVFPVAGKTQMK